MPLSRCRGKLSRIVSLTGSSAQFHCTWLLRQKSHKFEDLRPVDLDNRLHDHTKMILGCTSFCLQNHRDKQALIEFIRWVNTACISISSWISFKPGRHCRQSYSSESSGQSGTPSQRCSVGIQSPDPQVNSFVWQITWIVEVVEVVLVDVDLVVAPEYLKEELFYENKTYHPPPRYYCCLNLDPILLG